MDAKTILNPKGWLIGVGIVNILFSMMNYMMGGDVATTALEAEYGALSDRAGAGFHQAAKALHEGGFAGPRRADHGDGLAGLHVDVEATKRHDVAVLGFGFVDVVEAVSMQNRIAHLHSPFSTLAKSAFSARRVVTNNATTTAAKTARDTRMIWAHG